MLRLLVLRVQERFLTEVIFRVHIWAANSEFLSDGLFNREFSADFRMDPELHSHHAREDAVNETAKLNNHGVCAAPERATDAYRDRFPNTHPVPSDSILSSVVQVPNTCESTTGPEGAREAPNRAPRIWIMDEAPAFVTPRNLRATYTRKTWVETEKNKDDPRKVWFEVPRNTADFGIDRSPTPWTMSSGYNPSEASGVRRPGP